MIELFKIKKDFNSAAKSYDQVAILQKEVSNRLFERISLIRLLPLKILDIGSGTGFLTEKMVEFFPNSEIVALDIAEKMHEIAKKKLKNQNIQYICGDMHQLDFEDKNFDLIVSNLTLQWSYDLALVFQEMSRVLADDGLVFFSTIAEGSLDQLKLAYQSISPNQQFQTFNGVDSITKKLKNSGLNQMVIESEKIIVDYEDIYFLMRDLKEIGANNKIALNHKGLIGKQKWTKFKNAYPKNGNFYEAHYNIIYTHAFKTLGGSYQPSDSNYATHPSIQKVQIQKN